MRKTAFLFAVALIASAFFMPADKVCAYDGLTIIGEKGVYYYDKPQIEYFFAGTTIVKIDDVVSEICQKEYVPYKDAYINFDPDGKPTFKKVKEVSGKAVDAQRLKDDILSALSVGGGAIKPVYNTVKPQICEKDLNDDIVVRGKFSTDFSSSTAERKSNIKTAIKAVNGFTLCSGEIFSFNDTVGKRSEVKGYKNAKIIVDGNFVDGIGGGVCQVSTTLYNAALLSGLKIKEYHPHTLAVSYVESSFDAMVSYGACDLKFENVTSSPVYIKGFVKDDRACFIIYGERTDVEYERSSVIEEKVKPAINYIFNAGLDEKEYIIKVAAKDGIVSSGYLIKKVGGKVVSRKLLRKDVYKPVNGIIETGDAERSPVS